MVRIIEQKISQGELAGLCRDHFETMVKFVVDVTRETMAVGGELHADGEALLLEKGSAQSDLWGGNFYPWHEAAQRCEFTSFINIRPADDNASMEIIDEVIRNRVGDLAERFLLAANEVMREVQP